VTTETTILSPGRNCERIASARRVAWLVDGERYFAALADSLERAKRSVLMLGWDFHSRMRLRRDGGEEEGLLDLLERVVRSRRGLHVRMLGWDFAMIYSLEREFLPLERFQRRTHRRLHFRLDGEHPPGASHHQKIVVIDDAIAFCGGLDATICRWDTREHRAEDPRRNDPGQPSYGPFHDVQMLVDGDAARALGSVARARWQRATGHHLRVREVSGDPWPPDVEPDLRDVGVAIARTRPAYRDDTELRHVERLYVDAIRGARECLYLENQYFTSSTICDALVQRLGEEDAPEVAIVLPRTLSGWLEEKTMGALMAQVVERLRKADTRDRLRVYVPVLPDDASLTVHAKLLIADDRLVRVGSANLSNRSMGLDTECDLAIESTPGCDRRAEIRRFRNDLLAEHLGVSPDEVAHAVEQKGSLLRGVDSLCHGERRLERFEAALDTLDAGLLPAHVIFDPERPIPFEDLKRQLVDQAEAAVAPERLSTLVRLAWAVSIPLGLVALWQWTPLSEGVSPESLSTAAETLGRDPVGPWIGLAVFVVAAIAMVPVVSLIVASALVFGFGQGSLVALAGSLLSAIGGYGLGRLLWRDAVRRLAGERLDGLNRRLSRRGVLATALVRIVPVAPFAVVNLVAGASHLRLRDFALGTLLGMAPGTLALTFFGRQAVSVARDPSPTSIATALGAVVLVVGLAVLSQRLIGSDAEATEAGE